MSNKIFAIIVAAGKGERAGGGLPKQFSLLAGKAVLAHSVDAFLAHPLIDHVIVVIGAGQEQLLADALEERLIDNFVIGGAERQNSVRAGLEAARTADIVLIHDAARPFLPATVIDRLINALDHAEGAVPALPVVDTLAHSSAELGEVIDRTTLARVQTPQAFRYNPIMTSHRNWKGGNASDDAQMVRAAGFRVVPVEGDQMLDKITHASDFAAAEARYSTGGMSRTGMGYDVHRLEAGQDLWLCGIKIAHDKGLSGHSDADVALHALTDALLGAIAAGDIGDHFPPSDPQWRGAASHQFLSHAAALVLEANATISSIDLTIICEAPKIGPHRETMRARIAQILGLPLSRVSVKATTTERLGFTGRGEGIAAQAIATVYQRIKA